MNLKKIIHAFAARNQGLGVPLSIRMEDQP